MSDIFLSYNREDQDRARLFAEALQAAGYNVWWDVALRAGEDYDRTTERALNQARAVVVLWSSRSVESRWVRAEATVAQRNHSFVPVMIEDCVRPVMFELTQSADLVGWDGDPAAPAWQAFLRDLKAHLARSGGGEAAPVAGPRPSERRQVAVLSCALARSGDEGLEHDDPEEWQDLVQGFRAAVTAVLAGFDCTVAAGAGGAVTALFGLDRSREDDALRAVRAALSMREAVTAGPGNLDVRIGVDCGPTIVGGDAATPAGPALDGAAHLQTHAEPGAVLISPAVARLAGGFLELEARGARAFRVLGESEAHTRFELSKARGLSRFVGRDDVLDSLRRALDASAEGTGQVVGVMAEAGVGKSRLCFEFVEYCRTRGVEVFTAAATQERRDAPLFAVIQLIRSFCRVDTQDDAATTRAKVEARTLALDPGLGPQLPTIFDLLEAPDPDRPPPPVDPDARRRQLVTLARHLVRLASAAGPTVTLVEDLHWVDDASAAFLEQSVAAREGLRNLLILNYRPEFAAAWMQNCQQIALAPLAEGAVGSLLDDLLGADPSVAPLVASITAQTKGNPYFVEEVVQTLAETGKIEGARGAYRLVGALDRLEVPPTVKAVVSARIDRLPDRERNLLQVAAVIGTTFPEPLLIAASGLPTREVEAALAELRRAEFIVERSAFPVAEHNFKHPLTLEMALASLVKARRRELHAAVARAIEVESGDAQAEVLAQHWDEAGEAMLAAQWRLRASARVVRTDFFAAARHWRRVMELCRESDDPNALLMYVDAASQLLTSGYRLGMDIEEAKALLAQSEAVIGPENAVFRLVLSICYSRMLCVAGDVDAYLALSEENHAAAMATGDLRLSVFAKMRLCDAHAQNGTHVQGLVEADAAMALYPRSLPRPEWLPDYHPYCFFGFMRGIALSWMGRLEEAERQLREIIDFAAADGSPEVVAWSSLQLAITYHLTGDAARSRQAAETIAVISDRVGSPLLLVYRHVSQVWASLASRAFEDALTATAAVIELVAYVEQQWGPMGRMFCARCFLELNRLPEAVEMAEAALAGFQTCSIKQFEIEAWGVLARARLRLEGPAGVAAADHALARAEQLIDAEGTEALRPFLLEWRAELEQVRGDTILSHALMERAAATHAQHGAPRQADRVRGEVLAMAG